MVRRSLLAVLALLPALLTAQTIALKPGIVITRSGSVKAHVVLRGEVPKAGLVTIRGKGITVDFRGATIRSPKDVFRDRENLTGTGLLIENSENVVVKNAIVHGFRFNILVKNSKNVRIAGCDLSYSRAIRMMKEGQPVDTFLNLRDSNAWRDYGAGVWLEGSKNCRVERTKSFGGTIGAALVDCENCTIHDSDFSFCGGWGVALASTKRSVVSWNHLDFDNRVWAGGWGGDSAGMAVADDCDDNFIVGNSMTHGGDGFFLSNRNDVGPVVNGVFTPKGGSDNNVIAYNDGSWSPANAFEGTFSVGNVYYRNQANDSGFGFWLGFSNDSKLIENQILNNRIDGIAIEHGMGTQIVGNKFVGNGQSAIHLWANPAPERKPFPSAQIDLYKNVITDSPWAYRLEGSFGVAAHEDKVERAKVPDFEWGIRPAPETKEVFETSAVYKKLQRIVRSKPVDFRFYRETGLPIGIEWIQPDDYAPRDFTKQPAAYRLRDPGTLEIYRIDPSATLKLPDQVSETWGGKRVLVSIDSGVTGIGEDKPVEIPVLSKTGRSLMTIKAVLRTVAWDRRWFSWRGLTYDDQDGWRKLFDSKPLREDRNATLGGDWSGRSPATGVPNNHFALVATTKVKLKKGRYAFDTLSDDGIRLYVDGMLLIDRWNHHGPTPDRAPIDLEAGVHDLLVQYCQEDGAAVLRLDWSPDHSGD